MTKIDNLKVVIIRLFGSHNKYRVQKVKDYNITYDRWDTSYAVQVRVLFIFWMYMKVGYYSCERAYEDIVRWKKVPHKIKIKRVMSKTDLVMELLEDV